MILFMNKECHFSCPPQPLLSTRAMPSPPMAWRLLGPLHWEQEPAGEVGALRRAAGLLGKHGPWHQLGFQQAPATQPACDLICEWPWADPEEGKGAPGTWSSAKGEGHLQRRVPPAPTSSATSHSSSCSLNRPTPGSSNRASLAGNQSGYCCQGLPAGKVQSPEWPSVPPSWCQPGTFT